MIYGTAKERLIALSWTGDEESLLERAIAGGRKENEYWSPLSRASLGLGLGLQGILLLLIWTDAFPSVRYLSFLVGLSPILCLLPPGLPFFFLYLRSWRAGLRARILRDTSSLPDTPGHSGEGRGALARDASRRAFLSLAAAGFFLALDLGVNIVAAFWIRVTL